MNKDYLCVDMLRMLLYYTRVCIHTHAHAYKAGKMFISAYYRALCE